jgi:predicted ATPase/DNA-binding SARP family transcriptional activator
MAGRCGDEDGVSLPPSTEGFSTAPINILARRERARESGMKAPWQIELLGGLRVTQGDRVLTRFRTQKTGALLAYLAYYPQRTHPRDHLIELLWPEADPAAGSNSLSQALSSLRRQLEPAGVPPGTVLVTNRASVRLNPAAFTTDVAEFEAALHAAASAGRDAERAVQLGRAVELYRGELLAGSYERWVLEQREWLAESYFQALGQLLALLEQAGDLPRALECARRGVLADPLREEARRDLMHLYATAGQPDAALRQYHELERLLKQDLDAQPSPTTQALARQLSAAPPAQPAAQPTASEPSRRPLASPRLPAQLTRFFGREKEVARLQALLIEEERRLVTLTGPGGSGKSRLAIEVAGQLREPFGDAVWFVPLQDLADPQLIPDKVLDVLRLPRSPQLLPLEQLVTFFSHRSALLLLDNFEHLVAKGASLVQALLERTERLTVLVTSRQRLGLPGEREFPVCPLPTPKDRDTVERLMRSESIQLFVDRAQAVRLEFELTEANAASTAALCQKLEGLPLALELAAARAAVLTPAQMLTRLSQRFDFLATHGRAADARHRSLRTALDWSHQLLSPELQRFFARLSIFRGGWTLAAAETVCEEPRALEHLSRLRESSLVDAAENEGEIRFRLLETLREYAAEQLPTAERALLAKRHAEYYMTLGEQVEPELQGPEMAAWLDRLEREHDNAWAALAWSQTEAGDLELGLRLAGALRAFWNLRGYWGEVRGWLVRALAHPKARARTRVRAKALYVAAVMAQRLGDYGAAHSLYGESLAIWREIGSRPDIAASLSHLAYLAHRQAQARVARSLYEESLMIWWDLGSKEGITACLEGLGRVAGTVGQSERAARLLGAAVALRDTPGATWKPEERAEHERHVDASRAALGEEAFTAAWTSGRLLRLDEAIGLALDEAEWARYP